MITNAKLLTMPMFWHTIATGMHFLPKQMRFVFHPGTSQLRGTGVSVVLYFTAIVCPS